MEKLSERQRYGNKYKEPTFKRSRSQGKEIMTLHPDILDSPDLILDYIMGKTWVTYLRIVPLVLCGLLSLGTAQAETVTVLRVIDGDTCLLEDGRRVRYLGIDAPEKGDPHAEEATLANNTLVGGKTVRLEPSRTRRDRDDRMLAYVFVGDTFVNEELVRQGYAHLRHSVRAKYLQRLLQAQDEARTAGLGLWAQAVGRALTIVNVHADAEGNERDNLYDEFIVIENQGQTPIDLTGWTVSDSSSLDPYLFPNFILPAKVQVTLRTGFGKNTESDLFWGSRRPVWNNDGDTIFIRDAAGRLILSHIY